MEQSLKARLIGATVLVALAVVLVPELLSGRGPGVEAPATSESPGSRTFTIEIGDSGARPAVQAPGSAAPAAGGSTRAAGAEGAGDAAAAAPSTPAVPPAPGGAAPTAAPAVPAPQPPTGDAAAPAAAPARAAQPAAPAPVPSNPPAGAGWMVQVGAFGTADAARSLVQDLAASGIAAKVSPVARGGRTLHRVRVGPVAERAEAEQLAKRLAARGLPATVVAGD